VTSSFIRFTHILRERTSSTIRALDGARDGVAIGWQGPVEGASVARARAGLIPVAGRNVAVQLTDHDTGLRPNAREHAIDSATTEVLGASVAPVGGPLAVKGRLNLAVCQGVRAQEQAGGSIAGMSVLMRAPSLVIRGARESRTNWRYDKRHKYDKH